MSAESEDKTPLATFSVPEHTIAHDFELQTRYQDFTAEILRISLLAITAVGLILHYLHPSPDARSGNLSHIALGLFFGSLVAFSFSATFALLHRYLSVDSLSCHLRSVRLDLRNEVGDKNEAYKERERRKTRFRQSNRLLLAAVWIAAIGACAMGSAFISLAWPSK